MPVQPRCSSSRARTLMHDYLFTCIIVSPRASRADQSRAHPMQTRRDTSRNRYPQSPSDIPTHAPATADRHDHVSTSAHVHKHDTCPHLLCTHAQRRCCCAYNTCLARIYTRAAAHTPVHARSSKHAQSGNPRTRSRRRAHTLLHFTVI